LKSSFANKGIVLSRCIVQRIDPGPSTQHLNFTSWARNIPDFFTAQNSAPMKSAHREGDRQHIYAIELHSVDKQLQQQTGLREIAKPAMQAESFKSGPSEPDSMHDFDLEKASVQTNIGVSKKSNGAK